MREDQVLEFAALYGRNCAGCHGAEGRLGPAPPLNDAVFRSIVPSSELESVIARGRDKTLMPAFGKENGGTLTSAQVQVLVHEIKGIPYRITKEADGVAKIEPDPQAAASALTWGPSKEAPDGVPSYLPPKNDASDNAGGKKIADAAAYERACATCHGDAGRGIREGDGVRRTINDRVFLSLSSDQVLRRYVITGRPDLGMPGFADARPGDPQFQPLTAQEVAGLVALLASWREAAAGNN